MGIVKCFYKQSISCIALIIVFSNNVTCQDSDNFSKGLHAFSELDFSFGRANHIIIEPKESVKPKFHNNFEIQMNINVIKIQNYSLRIGASCYSKNYDRNVQVQTQYPQEAFEYMKDFRSNTLYFSTSLETEKNLTKYNKITLRNNLGYGLGFIKTTGISNSQEKLMHIHILSYSFLPEIRINNFFHAGIRLTLIRELTTPQYSPNPISSNYVSGINIPVRPTFSLNTSLCLRLFLCNQ